MIEHIRISKDSTLDLQDIQNRTEKVFKKNARSVADELRDELREEYAKVVHRTSYGDVAQVDPRGPASLGTSALVVREQNGEYFIGPKLGGIMNGDGSSVSYDSIFTFITEGTSRGGKGWWFRLPNAGGRSRASSDGMWYTRGQRAKPFIDTVYDKNVRGAFGYKVDKFVRIPVYKEVSK